MCSYYRSPQFTGVYAVNNELQKARRLFEGELFGPESFAVDNDGKALSTQQEAYTCSIKELVMILYVTM